MRPCMIHGPGNKGNLNLLTEPRALATIKSFAKGYLEWRAICRKYIQNFNTSY